jgi:hypothetical protein
MTSWPEVIFERRWSLNIATNGQNWRFVIVIVFIKRRCENLHHSVILRSYDSMYETYCLRVYSFCLIVSSLVRNPRLVLTTPSAHYIPHLLTTERLEMVCVMLTLFTPWPCIDINHPPSLYKKNTAHHSLTHNKWLLALYVWNLASPPCTKPLHCKVVDHSGN